MLTIDLTGRRALIAGIADERGFGFAIAKQLAAAGASVCAATWPPAYRSFKGMLERGRYADAMRQPDGTSFSFERVYPLDARFELAADVPAEVRDNRRYREFERFTIEDLARSLAEDFGPPALDIVVHCIANGPEVTKPLLDASQNGYMQAINASSYSFVGLAKHLSPLLRPDASFLCLSFIAGERVIPGYGGGMSSAKAALENDTRVLAYELGRRCGARVNCISAGPWASRAAGAVGFIEMMATHVANNAPIPRPITASEVADVAAFLASPLARAVTGTTTYVDNGSHCMGIGFSGVQ